jgi:hypothetical protein
MWKQTVIPDQEIQSTDPPLARKIIEWRSMGAGHMFPPGDGPGW